MSQSNLSYKLLLHFFSVSPCLCYLSHLSSLWNHLNPQAYFWSPYKSRLPKSSCWMMLTNAESVTSRQQGEKKALEAGSRRWKADVLMHCAVLIIDRSSWNRALEWLCRVLKNIFPQLGPSPYVQYYYCNCIVPCKWMIYVVIYPLYHDYVTNLYY